MRVKLFPKYNSEFFIDVIALEFGKGLLSSFNSIIVQMFEKRGSSNRQ